jgi:hypothetical protein
MHQPQWTLSVYWSSAQVTVEAVSDLVDHPSVRNAGRLLGKHVLPDISNQGE